MDTRYKWIQTAESDHAAVLQAVTLKGKSVCVKRRTFSTVEGRNAAFLSQSLQKLLRHPNILRVYKSCVGEENGHFVETEEEWGGTDLSHLAASRATAGESWNDAELIVLLSSCSTALSYAQRHCISHRDIKPQNIFLTEEKVYKIGDFDCAESTETLCSVRVDSGTSEFFSPELKEILNKGDLKEVKYDPYKADVFSLGLTIVYLLRHSSLKECTAAYAKQCVCTSALHPKLKELLEVMLSETPSDRPSFSTLESKLPYISSLITIENCAQSLQSESEEDWIAAIETLMKVPHTVNVSAVIDKAEEKVTGERECASCGKRFLPQATNTEDFASFLCGVCLNRSSHALECTLCTQPVGEWFFLSCRKHFCCSNHLVLSPLQTDPSLFILCPKCEKPTPITTTILTIDFITSSTYPGVYFTEFDSNAYSRSYCSIASRHIEELKRKKCHFCLGPLTPDWRFLPHNGAPAFICGRQCFRQHFSGTERCPQCRHPVSGNFLHNAHYHHSVNLGLMAEELCRICKICGPTVVFNCGHGLCEQCLSTLWKPTDSHLFPCCYCGQAFEKSAFPELMSSLPQL